MDMVQIDINSDIGESYGAYKIGNDEEILKYVTSVNIACGYHAGDPVIMRKTVENAIKNGVAIGAHPGYPDLSGFGRRDMKLGDDELFCSVLYQVGALKSMTEALGGKLQHVKPHGAMYNSASVNYNMAKVISEAVYKIDPDLILVGLANSQLTKAASDTGLRVANEIFADRRYQKDGTLVPRSHELALIHDEQQAVNQVKQILQKGVVTSIDNCDIPIKADSVCIHGDSPEALLFAKRLNEELNRSAIMPVALSKSL
jgi:UPF0271 protein